MCTELRNRLLQNDLPYCVTHVFFQVPRSSADVAQDSEPVAEHRDVAPPTISDNADPFVPFRSYTQRIVTLMRDLLGQLCRGTLSSALKFPDDATLLDMYSAFDALPLPTEASAPQSRSAKNAKNNCVIKCKASRERMRATWMKTTYMHAPVTATTLS